MFEWVREIFGINININNKEAKMIDAIKNKKLDVVNKILKYDINIDYIDRTGYTPLMWAAEKGYLEIVNVLLAHNANINYISVNGNTALILAAKKIIQK